MISHQERQAIVNDFVERHGKWDLRLFRDEVKATNGQHPAWSCFTWDKDLAADKLQIEEARRFVHGLKIPVAMEVVERGRIVIRETSAPALVSPLAGRGKGGGYRLFDPSDPEHLDSFAGEAATALQAWLNRYEATLLHVGVKPSVISKVIAALEAL